MKRIAISVFLCTTLMSMNAHGQETDQSINTTNKAALFSFSGLALLNLGMYESGVGGKYFLSPNFALRGGLQFGIAGETVPSNPPAGQNGIDGSASASLFGVSAAAEIHLLRSRVSPYVGGGAGVSFTSTESKNPVFGTAAQTTIKNNRNGEVVSGSRYYGGSSIHLFGMGGLEYFPMRNISLAAEYRLEYLLTSRYDEEQITGSTTVTAKLGSANSFGFSTGGALVFAVYF